MITPQVTGDALKTMAASMNATHQGNLIYVTAPVTQPNSDAATNNVTYLGYYRFNYDATNTAKPKSFVRIEPSGLEKVISTDQALGLPASTNYGIEAHR